MSQYSQYKEYVRCAEMTVQKMAVNVMQKSDMETLC